MAARSRSLPGLILALLLAAAAGATGFVPGIADLPLAPGLQADAEHSMSFDTPTGRIVEGVAIGRGLTEAEIRRFYAETLPALGWRAASERLWRREGEELILRFTREGEELILRFTRAGDVLTVRFDLRPR